MSIAASFNYSVAAGGAVHAGKASQGAAPVAPIGAYRNTQEWLFVDVTPSPTTSLGLDGNRLIETIPRAGISPAHGFDWGIYGPAYFYVENKSKWAWTNPGGDWINTAGISQATTLPHFTFSANGVTTGSAGYTADITAGVQASQAGNRWNAYIVKCVGGARSIASRHHLTVGPPIVNVTYTDGSTAALACTTCTQMVAGTAYTQTGRQDQPISSSVALEFERPTKAASSAVLAINISQHTAATAVISGYLSNPPSAPGSIVTGGVAAGYPGDAGLGAAPGVLVAHRYADGTTLANYVGATGMNAFSRANWDLDVLGLGAEDLTKLPTAWAGQPVAGKWLQQSNTVSLVSSSFTGDGFIPLSQGNGALRISVPAGAGSDGAQNGGFGSLGSNMVMVFPKDVCGTDALKRTFVRFYARFADTGKALGNTKMFGQPSGSAGYGTMYGKWGVGVAHWTSFGGNNRTGGGGLGWSNRLGYGVAPLDAPISGMDTYMHSLDNFPDQHNMPWNGGGGGGGSLYPNRWYCIEVECNLNTMNLAGGSPSDGEMRVWLDGRLVMTNTGWKYRDGPLSTSADNRLPPFRQMGPWGLTLNHYQGGVLVADSDFITFIDGVVCSTSYIGPMA